MTDISRYKSVAIQRDTVALLKKVAKKQYRSQNAMISKLVIDFVEYQAEKKGMSLDDYLTKELEYRKIENRLSANSSEY